MKGEFFMKCNKCGNNNATFHYKANINGQTTETHLCAECAQKAGFTEESLFGSSIFGSNIFGNSMFGGSMIDFMFSDAYRSFFAPAGRGFFSDFDRFMMPVIAVPRLEMVVRSDEENQKEKVSGVPDADLSRRRELNALREQLSCAVKAEEFEKAAELRDKLRELEKKED